MSKKLFWILAIAYGVITFLLHFVFQTFIGSVLMLLSFLGMAWTILYWVFNIVRLSIRQEIYNRRKNQDKDEDEE